jgi:hypothetical protein
LTVETALVLTPKWLIDLTECLFSRESEVAEEMRIVCDVAESGALSASLVPESQFFQQSPP